MSDEMNRTSNAFFVEIKSQPKALKHCLDMFGQNDMEKIAEIGEKYAKLNSEGKNPIKRIGFIGIGTSYYAALVAKYYFNSPQIRRTVKLECEVYDAGEFCYHMEYDQDDADLLLVLISQSGESGEIIEILNQLKKSHFPSKNIWAITNASDSSLDIASEYSIYIYAGSEQTVTNKTYLCTLAALNILIRTISLHYSNMDKKKMYEGLYRELYAHVGVILRDIEDLLENWDKFARLFRQFLSLELKQTYSQRFTPRFINFISRGTGLATTGQAALNTKEVAKIYAESISASMFRHGCIEMVDSQFRAITISNAIPDRESMTSLVQNISTEWGNGRVIFITNLVDQALRFERNPNVLVIHHRTADPYLAPIYEIVPLQMLAYTLAELNGFKPGSFRYGTKITKDF